MVFGFKQWFPQWIMNIWWEQWLARLTRWICDESDNLAVKWNSHQEERAASSFYWFLPHVSCCFFTFLWWICDENNNLTVKWNLHWEKRVASSINSFFTFFWWICDESDNLAVKWNSHQEERAASSFYCFLPQGGASVLDICAVNQTWSFSYQIFLLYLIKSFHPKI